MSQIDANTIAQAFAYHKVLAVDSDIRNGDISDVDTDDEHEYDEFESDDSRSLSSLDDRSSFVQDDDNDDNKKRDNNYNSDNEDIVRYLVEVKFDSNLAASASRAVYKRRCTNASFRDGLWVVAPLDLINELTRLEMGFLSQVAHIGLRAKLHWCENFTCRDMREKMDEIAPKCNWTAFRKWALLAMSCQAAMEDEQKLSQAHTHLAQAVAGLCMALKKCLEAGLRKEYFVPFLDGDSKGSHRIDLAEVTNLIHWMAQIQNELGIGPRKFGRWNHYLLPSQVTLPSIETATLAIDRMGICKNRLWNLVNVSDRKQSVLPDIVLSLSPYTAELRHHEHDRCTPSKCQWAQMDSTRTTQLHKCVTERETHKNRGKENSSKKNRKMGSVKEENHDMKTICNEVLQLPVELLESALERGKSTAWLCRKHSLDTSHEPYIAISHVWSDGTGVGGEKAGTVNACLFNYFAGIAKSLKCKAIWWDAISIPQGSKARSKALKKMHSNYANAQYTVVHDSYLLNFPWKEDGSPCLALVLSTWFTRGWTALELLMSKKVLVLFKDPDGRNAPLMKDLDADILAKSPSVVSRAHWLATVLIQRLRKPIDNVGDLLAILSPRSTSWVRDRTIISALLAGVPDFDSTAGESAIVTKILAYLGKIPHSCLLHGKPTMCDLGQYSWCAATLDDMPVDIAVDIGGSYASNSSDLLEIDEGGVVEGKWRWRQLQGEDSKVLRSHGNDLAAVVKVDRALRHWRRCLLLRQPSDRADSQESLALLVVPTSVIKAGPILKCRYIGAVVEIRDDGKERDDDSYDSWFWTVRIGDPDKGGLGMLADRVVDVMNEFTDEPAHSSDNDSISDIGPGEREPKMEDRRPRWLYTKARAAKAPPAKFSESPAPESSKPPEMSDDHLFIALKSKNEDAARYLVANGIHLSSLNAKDLLSKLGASDQGSLVSLKMLGDIFVENKHFRRAIDIYKGVIASYEDLKPGGLSKSMENDLRISHTKYCLGKVYLQARDMVSEDPTSEAQRLFDAVLDAFDARKGSQAYKDEQSKGMRRTVEGTRRFRKLSYTISEDESAIQEGQANDEKQMTNQMKAEGRWYRLELNTVAEFTLLYLIRFDFANASIVYRRALKKFGPTLKVADGFNAIWADRQRKPFKKEREAEEQAADVYHRALKQFDTMFHKNHILIAITSLHLGVNYMQRSYFSEAEESLRRALESFKSHAIQNVEDPFLGLIHYYLGLVFVKQSSLNKAAKYLNLARSVIEENKVNADFEEDGTVLELSIIYELGNRELLRARPDYSKAGMLFQHVVKTLSEIQRTDKVKQLARKTAIGFCRVQIGAGITEQAIPNLISAIELDRKAQGNTPHDYYTCQALVSLGTAYEQQGQFEIAAEQLLKALAGFKFLRGDNSYDYLRVSSQLGSIYGKGGDAITGLQILHPTYDNLTTTLGRYHISTLQASMEIGHLNRKLMNLQAAAEAYERAYMGLHTKLGLKKGSTADAAQMLGDVYFDQGKLTKARELYKAAYNGFKARATTKRSRRDHDTKKKGSREAGTTVQVTNSKTRKALPITNIKYLFAAMNMAKVSSLIRHTESYNEAEKYFKRAINGFQASNEEVSAMGLLDAQLQLGCFYRDRRRFTEAGHLIRCALRGLLQLRDRYSQRNTAEIHVKILQAKLALGQLFLEKKDNEENSVDKGADMAFNQLENFQDMPNDNDPHSLILEAQSGLLQLLGSIDLSTLFASTVVGEMYISHPHALPKNITQAERYGRGEFLLKGVLHTYREVLHLEPGHPSTLRVIEILISFYGAEKQTANCEEMKSLLWNELVKAHGIDVAAMIMDMNNVRRPRHEASDDDDSYSSDSYSSDSYGDDDSYSDSYEADYQGVDNTFEVTVRNPYSGNLRTYLLPKPYNTQQPQQHLPQQHLPQQQPPQQYPPPQYLSQQYPSQQYPSQQYPSQQYSPQGQHSPQQHQPQQYPSQGQYPSQQHQWQNWGT